MSPGPAHAMAAAAAAARNVPTGSSAANAVYRNQDNELGLRAGRYLHEENLGSEWSRIDFIAYRAALATGLVDLPFLDFLAAVS